MSRSEEVLVIASPYDGERLRRVLEQMGRRAHVTDGGAATEAALQNGKRTIVLSLRSTDATRQAWLDRLTSSRRPIVVVADAGQSLPEGLLRVQRPVDPTVLAQALDRLEASTSDSLDLRHSDPPKPVTAKRAVPGSPSRVRIMALAELARQSDYFTLLGLPRHVDATAVCQAYEAIRAELELAGLAGIARELQAEMAEIRESIDEARLVLDNDELRLAYRRALEQSPERDHERPNERSS